MRTNKTIFDPVATGKYQDAEIARQVIATKQGPKHTLIQGMTGSGKTDGEKPVLLTCAARGAVQVIVDVRKKTQSYGSLAPILDWLIVDDGTARAAFTRLIDHVIPARTEALAMGGFSSWDPKCGLQFMRFQVEEAWDFADADELTMISLAARSAGVQLILSIQRASHDMMSTALRDQLGTIKCYGLRSSWGASLLSDEVEDAGATPQKWADEYPGMHYMEQGGLSIGRKATPIRAYTDSGPVKFKDVAEQLGPFVSKCDAVTAAAWGKIYADRRTPMQLIENVGKFTATESTGKAIEMTKQQASDAPRPPQAAPVQEDDDMHVVLDPPTLEEDGVTVRLGSGSKDRMVLQEPDPEPGFSPTIHDEITDRDESRPSRRLGGEIVKVTREEFNTMMETRRDELIADGVKLIRAADFAQVVARSGWSRGTVYGLLKEWEKQQLLAKTEDGWVPVRNA